MTDNQQESSKTVLEAVRAQLICQVTQEQGNLTFTPQPPGYPAFTPQPPGYPTFTPQPPGYPAFTPQPPGYPTFTPQPPGYPTLTPQPPIDWSSVQSFVQPVPAGWFQSFIKGPNRELDYAAHVSTPSSSYRPDSSNDATVGMLSNGMKPWNETGARPKIRRVPSQEKAKLPPEGTSNQVNSHNDDIRSELNKYDPDYNSLGVILPDLDQLADPKEYQLDASGQTSDSGLCRDSSPSPSSHGGLDSLQAHQPHPTYNEVIYLMAELDGMHDNDPYQSSERRDQIMKVIIDYFQCFPLAWDPDWLQVWSKEMPPDLMKGWHLKSTKDFYRSASDYLQTYLPLILVEIWTHLKEGTTTNLPSIRLSKIFVGSSRNTILFGEFIYRKTGPCDCDDDLLMEIMQKYHLKRGTLVKIESKRVGLSRDLFGYCSWIKPLGDNVFELSVQIHPDQAEMIRRISNIEEKTPTIEIQPLSFYMKTFLLEIAAVVKMAANKLTKIILKPVAADLKWNFSTSSWTDQEKDILFDVTNGKDSSQVYNELQKKALIGCLNMARGQDNGRPIHGILGPPGTGKTCTLIGSIKILYTAAVQKKKGLPCMLICAPSNEAVDEIALRLIEVMSEISRLIGRDLSIVRFGHVDRVTKPEVVRFTLERQAEKLVSDLLKDLIDKIQKDDKPDQKESDLKEIIDGLLVEMKIESDTLESLQLILKMMDHVEDDRDRHYRGKLGKVARAVRDHYEDKIVAGSDIILSTLSSSRYKKLFSKFFHFVFVDEVCQCTEPELLIALQHRFGFVILIGDPKQLPATVKSREAQKKGYMTSLFERLFGDIIKREGWSQTSEGELLLLRTQYRMPKELISFSAKKFYWNTIATSIPAKRINPCKQLVSERVFDLDSYEQCTGEKSIQNPIEAAFIIKQLLPAICDLVVTAKGNPDKRICTVGIAVPYSAQQALLRSMIRELSFIVARPSDKWMHRSGQLEVDIKTVDGFQGQERDVIIISGVRSREMEAFKKRPSQFAASGRRMNVFLTRARFARYIVMSGTNGTLTQIPLWKELHDDAKTRGVLRKVTAGMNEDTLRKMLDRKMISIHPLIGFYFTPRNRDSQY